jgi:succinate dehydrogenase / fumarate reductase membrane anchor subunit
MSLRTPLGRVLGLGTAKNGTDHFWAQRVSGVALLLLGIWFVFALLVNDQLAYADLIVFIRSPMNAVLLSMLSMVVAFHSYLGVQVVIEDYVHAPLLKIVSLLVSKFAHVFVAITTVYSILRIGVGA